MQWCRQRQSCHQRRSCRRGRRSRRGWWFRRSRWCRPSRRCRRSPKSRPSRRCRNTDPSGCTCPRRHRAGKCRRWFRTEGTHTIRRRHRRPCRSQCPWRIPAPGRSRLQRGYTFRQARPDCRTHTCRCMHCCNTRRPRRSPKRTRCHCCTLGHSWSCNCRCRHRLVRWNNCLELPCQPGRERRCLRSRSHCTTCMDPCRTWIRSTLRRHSCRMRRPKRCWWNSPRHCPGRSRCIPRFRPSGSRSHCLQTGPPLRVRGRMPWQRRSPRWVSPGLRAHTRPGPWNRAPRFRESPLLSCRCRQTRLRAAVWSRRQHSRACRC